MKYNVNIIMKRLESLGTEQIKRIYINHGAKKPLYGVKTRDLQSIVKEIRKNYELSVKLYETGNYDAMYLAGLIADPEKMSKEDFTNWIEKAYCHGLSDYTVARALAKSNMAQEIADEWINSKKDLYQSAGWTCYCQLLKCKNNDKISKEKIEQYLHNIELNIHKRDNRARYSMNNFVISVGTFYKPLQQEAYEVAKNIGKIYVDMGETSCKTPLAIKYIQKAIEKKKSNNIFLYYYFCSKSSV